MNFGMSSLPDNINLPAKNEQNPPSEFGDMSIATAWQPESEWGPGGIAHVCDITAMSWRQAIFHMTPWRSYDVTDVIYTTLSNMAGQSQCGNPIGSELVLGPWKGRVWESPNPYFKQCEILKSVIDLKIPIWVGTEILISQLISKIPFSNKVKSPNPNFFLWYPKNP